MLGFLSKIWAFSSKIFGHARQEEGCTKVVGIVLGDRFANRVARRLIPSPHPMYPSLFIFMLSYFPHSRCPCLTGWNEDISVTLLSSLGNDTDFAWEVVPVITGPSEKRTPLNE